eukprot:286669-Rhodomonas_salina.5
MALLEAALTKCTTLRALILANNSLLYRGLDSVSNLRACTSLSRLDLSNNGIHYPDVLASAIHECCSLTDLSLAGNPICKLGLAHLAIALIQNKELELVDINFSACGLMSSACGHQYPMSSTPTEE